YIFALIAVFVLIIACINFVNLTTARAANRAKEVGIRKSIGAVKGNLVAQFMGESLLMSFLALVLALAMVELFLPAFNELAGKSMSLTLFGDPLQLAGLIGIALVTGVLAGAYPSLVLSSFQPVKVLKGRFQAGGRSGVFRRTLVAIQFTLSILLVICTLIVSSQLSFIRERKLGFDRENLLYFPMRGDMVERYDAVREELLAHPGIVEMGAVSALPTDQVSFSGNAMSWPGQDSSDQVSFNFTGVSPDYVRTLGLTMVDGREFSRERTAELDCIMMNETAARLISDQSVVGRQVTCMDEQREIIGIFADYNYESMHRELQPLVFLIIPSLYRYAVVRTTGGDIDGVLAALEAECRAVAPEYPFEYHFLDEAYDNLYRRELRMETIFLYFTIVAIAISCLGLFGLASYMAAQRTKEVGIRKVLGASQASIVLLLSKEFILLVGLAVCLAAPAAWLAMRSWLENFAYRTGIGVEPFVVAGGIGLLAAVLTAGYQAVKAAQTDPAQSVRYE
ncbi:MAG: FtsX-like permease family protein, partial [candidate division Zixibacteria bacterium]|nr:FtsX-like permease family protein [candidate division Zixibacteria bacterium]